VVMMEERHPSSGRRTVRLRGLRPPTRSLLPDKSLGGPATAEEVCARSSLDDAASSARSNSSSSCAAWCGTCRRAVVPGRDRHRGPPQQPRVVARAIDGSDSPRAEVVLAQLRGRPQPCRSRGAVSPKELDEGDGEAGVRGLGE